MPSDPAADRLLLRNVEFIGGRAVKRGRGKSFARVSRTPGRTREINFFRVNNTFVLVDLPGYGYARISKTKKAEWRPMIESYLRRTTQLRGIVLLLDIRREPSQDDRAMLDFLAELGVPTIVALTKADKLTKADAREKVAEVSRMLALEPDQVIQFSAQTGEGRVELLEAISQLVEKA